MSASLPPQPPGTAPDPSMEDILASIRRILSDDEATAKPGATDPAPAEALAPADDDVMTLDETMLVAEPPGKRS